MLERLTTPQEAYNFKLGAALKMERTVLEILDAGIEEAQVEHHEIGVYENLILNAQAMGRVDPSR
jgi:ferritin-like metal-binding protein YciE